MNHATIRLMKDRRREMIPIDKIRVLNSRTRDERQFALNVQSIEANGQLKDIRVNDKFLAKDGFYELICGEGRLIAQQRLGKRRDSSPDYTVASLTNDIVSTTQAKDSYVREAQSKEGRLFLLLDHLTALWKDDQLMELLRQEGLAGRPELAGAYAYAPTESQPAVVQG